MPDCIPKSWFRGLTRLQKPRAAWPQLTARLAQLKAEAVDARIDHGSDANARHRM